MVVFLLVPFVFFGFSLVEPPRIVARPDYGLGVVFLERWQGEVCLGLERIVPVDEYLGFSIKEGIVESWQKQARQALTQKQLIKEPSGLIPDIELPRLPLLGEGSKIDISGRDRITFGGSQTVFRGITQTPERQSLFPAVKMEQELAVQVQGTVGDRMKITIDHDSQREEKENKIKLQYTGTEDEVIRSIELGDTRLEIPGTIYTGDLPTRQGLFGVSFKGKLAGADIYAVATREGAESQSESFTGRRRVMTDTIWDVDFIPRRFYRLPGVASAERLLAVRVYIDDRNSGNNQSAFKGIATVFPDYPDSVAAWSYDRVGGDFDIKTAGVDYLIRPGNILEFLTPIERNYIVGVVVSKENDTIGGGTVRDSIVLALLKPEVTDSLSLAWDWEMRSCYQVRSTDIKLETVRLFRYNPQGTHCDYETDSLSPYFGQKFVQLLGLDPNGDDKIEYPEFESKTGVLQFPLPRPFAAEVLSVREPIIYRVDPQTLPPGEGRKYFLVVSYYTVTETYYLGQTDILEKSERVVVNGEIKSRDIDYSIDYKTGIITFLRPLPPDADIKVTFEYRPWFSLSQKSLVGTRAEWAFAENGKIGGSLFHRSEAIIADKPTLGAEPFQRTVAEGDFSYRASSEKISAFLDGLPVLWAQTPSQFDIKTEGAISLPNPNTRGVLYLDDFEGTTITRDIANTGGLWSFASVPVGKDTNTFAQVPLRWRNPDTAVRKDSVFGPGIGDEGRETQKIVQVVFTPDSNDRESWAGMMQVPSGAIGMNFTEIENLEIVLRSRRGNGNLHISVGMAIDEDAPRRDKGNRIRGYDGILNTEDRNGNGILDEDEDTGLDGVFGADSLWTPESPDDGNDDYAPKTNPQGSEGNTRLRINSEDLDGNGFSRYNHYFEYSISLKDQRLWTPLFNAWRLYRLTLRDSTLFTKIGNPKWEDIRVVRLWLDGFEAADTIEIYSFQFTGSKWRNPKITDLSGNTVIPTDTNEKVWVTQVSNKTDPNYTSPFDLKRDITTGKTETEAALCLGYRSLSKNRQAVVAKTTAVAEDYRDYQEMRFYVHDDTNGLVAFIRLGSDSANFYEFRAPITAGRRVPGRDGKWFEFVCSLDSFPLLKVRRDSLGIKPDSSYTITQGEFSFRVMGLPSLASVRWLALGIENRTVDKANGGIWFNDIRLSAPRKEPGYGFTAQTNLRLADFIALAFNWSYSDPNFRRFSEGRGVKTGGFGQNLTGNLQMNLDRFLPRNWKVSLPFTYSFARQTTLPKFSPRYSDLRLPLERTAGQIGGGHSQELAFTNIAKQKSGSKILNYTLEAMGFSYQQRWAGSRSFPTYDSSHSVNWQWRYGISPDVKLRLGEKGELSLLPRDIRLGLSGGKRADIRGDTIRVDTLKGRGASGDFGVSLSPIEDLTVEYRWESDRDLLVANPETIFIFSAGVEASRSENFGVAYDFDLGDVVNGSIEFDGDYNHERPKIGTIYTDYRNITNSGEVSCNTSLDLTELLDRIRIGKRLPENGGRNEEADSLTRQPESLPPVRRPLKPRPGLTFPGLMFSELREKIEPIEINYTISRSSDYLGFKGPAPWNYRFGLTDTLPYDTLQGRLNRTRDRENNLRFATGLGYKDLTARLNYTLSWGENRAILGANADRSLTWPSIALNLNRVHNLFPKLATDSRLSTNYQRTWDVRGELLPLERGGETLAFFGRTASYTTSLNPLISWQTNWKKRISTTLSANYTQSRTLNYLNETGTNRSETNSRSPGVNLSLSYTFSAPKGLRFPFLRQVRFSSDLNLSCQIRYSQNLRKQTLWTEGKEPTTTPQQQDQATATSLGASYRFSRSIEAGLNTGYSYNRGITGFTTQRLDINIWLLFRF